ncbi:hypothetical protein B5807_07385 [Epicoccum nigrum]|uniref:Heterokaryon incompatibility domain-containing protein n=1 Tax=Epicoccum nigrum TaxID=105696 RepID=A0A1Y2LW38_EPING|nr:hypothetical protein B5807_07385 [Epicoccum nigrum]
MGLIYFKSRRVLIWLGKGDDTNDPYRAQLAIDMIVKFSKLYDSCFPDPTGEKLSALHEKLSRNPLFIHYRQWEALRRLYCRPWFTRVWVVQELGLSRAAKFYCGDSQFDRLELDRFERLMLGFKKGKMVLNGINMQTTDLGHDFCEAVWYITRNEVVEDPDTFFDFLRSTRGLQCTEPKDMIYAFLGHPSAFKRQLTDDDPSCWYPFNYYWGRPTIISPNYDKSYKFTTLCIDLAIAAVQDRDLGLQLLSCIAHDNETLAMRFPSWVPRWDAMNRPSKFYGGRLCYDASKGFSDPVFLIENTGKSRKHPRLWCKAMKLGIVSSVYGSLYESHPGHIASVMAALLPDIPRRGDISHIKMPTSSAYPYDDDFLFALAASLTAGLTTTHDFETLPADEHREYHLNIFKAWYRQGEAIEAGTDPDPADSEGAECFKNNFNCHRTHRVLFLTREGRFGLGPGITYFQDEVWLPMGAKMPFVFRPTGNGTYKVIGQTFLYDAMRGEAVQGKSEADFEAVTLE